MQFWRVSKIWLNFGNLARYPSLEEHFTDPPLRKAEIIRILLGWKQATLIDANDDTQHLIVHQNEDLFPTHNPMQAGMASTVYETAHLGSYPRT